MHKFKLFTLILTFNIVFSVTECENGLADGYECNNIDLLALVPIFSTLGSR